MKTKIAVIAAIIGGAFLLWSRPQNFLQWMLAAAFFGLIFFVWWRHRQAGEDEALIDLDTPLEKLKGFLGKIKLMGILGFLKDLAGFGSPIHEPHGEHEEKQIDLSSRQFRRIVILWYIRFVIISCAVLMGIGYWAGFENWLWLKWGLWDWKGFLGGFLVVYTILGVDRLGPGVRGVKLFGGKPIQDVFSGYVFVPPFFCSVEESSKTLLAIQIGRIDPKRNEAGLALEELPESLYAESTMTVPIPEPMRITFAEAGLTNEMWENVDSAELERLRKEGGEELFRRVTTDPVVSIGVRIESPRSLIQRVGPSRADWTRALAKHAEATLQQFCGQHTVAYVVGHMEEANECLLNSLERHVADASPTAQDLISDMAAFTEAEKLAWKKKGWGLEIEWVRIMLLGLPRHLNVAMAKARAAGLVKEATIREAEGTAATIEKTGDAEAKKTRAVGKAEAEVIRAKLTEEAEGRKKLVEVMGTEDGRFLAQLESAKEVAARSRLIVASPDNLIGSLIGVREGLRQVPRDPRDTKPPEPPKTTK